MPRWPTKSVAARGTCSAANARISRCPRAQATGARNTEWHFGEAGRSRVSAQISAIYHVTSGQTGLKWLRTTSTSHPDACETAEAEHSKNADSEICCMWKIIGDKYEHRHGKKLPHPGGRVGAGASEQTTEQAENRQVAFSPLLLVTVIFGT